MKTISHEDAVIRKVYDGDFETVLKSVGFMYTPRESVTVGDMEKHFHKAVMTGTEARVYG